MILRRITKHVRDQNSLAPGIGFVIDSCGQKVEGRSTMPGLCGAQGVDDLEEPKAVKIRIAGHDPCDSVLAHQGCSVQIVYQVPARFRYFTKALSQNGRVPTGFGQDTQSRAGQQDPDELPCRFAVPRLAVYFWMCADAQEFIANSPGQEPRRGLTAGLFDQVAARYVKFAVGVYRVEQDIGIDNEHVPGSVPIHSFVQCVTIGHVDVRTTTSPLRQGFAHLVGLLFGFFEYTAQAGLDQLRHRLALARCLLAQSLHYAVIDIQGRFHMGNHMQDMEVCQ